MQVLAAGTREEELSQVGGGGVMRLVVEHTCPLDTTVLHMSPTHMKAGDFEPAHVLAPASCSALHMPVQQQPAGDAGINVASLGIASQSVPSMSQISMPSPADIHWSHS
jgi:hypothetical protein